MKSELEFTYESDAVSSFLVIQFETAIIEYQARMIEENRIRYVIAPKIAGNEGVNRIYYNITSRIPLSLYLKRKKFSKEQILKFFLDIAVSANDSTGYLLYVSNFIFSPEYIFINPETLEPALVYVPAAAGGNRCGALQGFISELLLQHIHIEGFDNGNLVQRILSAVKCDTFNLKGFITLINELLYAREQEAEVYEPDGTQENEIWTNDQITGSKEKMQMKIKNKRKSGKTVSPQVVLALLLQFAMGGVIYLCREFLNNIGDNPAVTYAAVIMIVAAVDILLFRSLSSLKLAGVKEIRNDKGKAQPYALCPGEAAGVPVRMGMRNGRSEVCISDAQVNTGAGNTRNAKTGNIRNAKAGDILNAKTGDSRNAKASNIRNAKAGNICEKAGKSLALSMNGAEEGNKEDASSNDSAAVMNPESPGSCRTELLQCYAKGMRILKSTGRRSGDEDIIIDKDEFIIGRLAGHADYVINNNAVGKLHAELIYKNGACYVRDLNSMNGTYINDTRIESNKEYELKESDKLQLANSEFVLVMS